VSMPHRIDKRDYLSLMALVSNLNIDFIDGVNGSAIHPNAQPAVSIQLAMCKISLTVYSTDIGCWRAHVNIYELMVRDRIQSALVLEDDVDWDVLLKGQMTEFARGTRFLQNATLPMHSPYGDNWDLMTLGHNGVNNKPNKDQQYWITKDDPTVMAPSQQMWGRKPDLSAPSLAGDRTRLVFEVSKMTATRAYAVSLRGAARLLYDQSMIPNAQAIDLAMAKLCRYDNNWGSAFCLGAYPMLFGRYMAIGPINKDSDR
ncbi:glycosyltransferase family 25 protein, partial [Melanomma pulvis-pyrius CBS 109.77]